MTRLPVQTPSDELTSAIVAVAPRRDMSSRETWGSSSSWSFRSSVPARTSLTGHLLRPDRTCAPAHRASPPSCSAFAADDLLSRDPLALVLGMLLDQQMRQRSS